MTVARPITDPQKSSSFPALNEYASAFRQMVFRVEYGLKAARRAPQFSKR